MCMPGAFGGQEHVKSPEIEVMSVCEPTCGCQVSNLGPLQEQQMLLITEPAL